MDNYIGEIKAFPYTFVPEGWLLCNGQSLPAGNNNNAQLYQLLYLVIGTNYGGTPNQNFNLPNLMGVVPMGAAGSNAQPNNIAVGIAAGTESVTLNSSQTPQHSHNIKAFFRVAGKNMLTNIPSGNSYLTNGGSFSSTPNIPILTFSNSNNQSIALGSQTITPTTAVNTVVAHENRMPYLSLQWGICYQGTLPPRP